MSTKPSKVIEIISKRKWIESIDDMRDSGKSIMVTLKPNWFFKNPQDQENLQTAQFSQVRAMALDTSKKSVINFAQADLAAKDKPVKMARPLVSKVSNEDVQKIVNDVLGDHENDAKPQDNLKNAKQAKPASINVQTAMQGWGKQPRILSMTPNAIRKRLARAK